MPAIPGMDIFVNSMGGWVPQIMKWIIWGVGGIGILAVFVTIYFLMQYKFKVEIFERRGEGYKIKRDRARMVKQRDGTYKWNLLFARKKLPVPSDKLIYSNKVFLFKSEDSPDIYVPGEVGLQEEGLTISPVDKDTKMWVMNELKQAAIDYQAKSPWEQYSPYFIMMGTIVLCLAAVGLTVWLTFKYAGGGVGAMNALSASIDSWVAMGTAGAPIG